MRYLNKIIIVAIIAILLSGCALFNEKSVIASRDTEYLKAKNIPPLKIPPGISSSTIQANYPVSERNYPASSLKPNLDPPELNATSK